MKPTHAVVLLIAVSLSCTAQPPRHEQFLVGMSRAEATARFGEPDRTQTLTKSDESIWGPIESFWSEIPMGARVEIWGFASTLDGRRGQSELYFVDYAETAAGIGFHDDDAVYESRGEP